MVAETVSLGVLSLPAAVAGLGLAPAVVILISLGLIASYTGYVIGQFKWRFPHISSMADAGEVLMGRFGRELLFGGQMLFLIFLMASHLLTFTVAMNTLTSHGTCSIVFGIVGLIVSLLISLPRTLEKMSWLSLACEPFPSSIDTRTDCMKPLSVSSLLFSLQWLPLLFRAQEHLPTPPLRQTWLLALLRRWTLPYHMVSPALSAKNRNQYI